eukprot:g20173.t1
MGTCAELGCGPSALSGHSKSGDVLGLTNEKKTLSGNVKPPVVVPGDEFATNLQSAEMMLSECRFGEAWGFSTRALLVHSSGRGRRIKPWERAICYLLRAEALLDMGAPRRALTELHPAKELLERGRQGWPTEALKRIEEADARYHARKEENDQQRIEKENAKVPVTVITGFLGSGKTTLLNRILREQHGKRIAVIENEFGEVGIDSMLVEQAERTTETIVEMNNGCICCTLRGDFIEGMQKAVDMFTTFSADETGPKPMTHIVQNASTVSTTNLRLKQAMASLPAKRVEQSYEELLQDQLQALKGVLLQKHHHELRKLEKCNRRLHNDLVQAELDDAGEMLNKVVKEVLPSIPKKQRAQASFVALSLGTPARVFVGVGWDFFDDKTSKIDVALVFFSMDGHHISTVSKDGETIKGAFHTGHGALSAGVFVEFDLLPIEVSVAFLVAHVSTEGSDYSTVQQPHCTVIDAQGREILRYFMPEDKRKPSGQTGLIMARMFWNQFHERWSFQALGNYCGGSSWSDSLEDMKALVTIPPSHFQTLLIEEND